jgi:hypothetical protein
MMTFKVVSDDGVSWVPDVQSVTLCPGFMSVSPGDDVQSHFCEEYRQPADLVWHVTGPSDRQWIAIPVQVRHQNGRTDVYIVEEGTAYLLGPDGKTLDRLWNRP